MDELCHFLLAAIRPLVIIRLHFRCVIIEAFVFRFTSRLRGSKHFLEPRRREVREEGQRIVLVNSH